jgi:salicylate hydroxylase
MKIAIIGAGVAGCILARSLADIPGVDTVCLERVLQDDHSESGTGLNIGPNAVKALRLTEPALADAIAAASFAWKTWRVSLTDGTVLFDLPLDRVADCDGVRIRWSELYSVLRNEAADVIQYGCEIQTIARDPNAAAKTTVHYTHHGEPRVLDDIDLLIAADGRYSQTRETFAGAPAVRQLGVSIFRLLVPDTSAGLIDDYEQWFNGPNRLLSFRVPSAHIYIAGTFPIPADEPVPDACKTAGFLRAAYTPEGGLPSDQATWLIDTVCANTDALHWARMQESDMRFAEPDVQVMYLGDAAHGMVPTLGQGATQAIEDACCAVHLLRAGIAAGTSPRDWLDQLDAARRERVRFTMQLSFDASDTMLAGADPVAGTLKKAGPDFMGDLTRLYRDVTLPGVGS